MVSGEHHGNISQHTALCCAYHMSSNTRGKQQAHLWASPPFAARAEAVQPARPARIAQNTA